MWRRDLWRRRCFYAAAIGFSYHTQGNAPLAAAALVLQYYHCGIIGGLRDLRDDGEGENYILAKICLAAAGILLLVWALMIVFAL